MASRVVRIGRDNSTLQGLKALRTNRSRRQQTGTFIVEGVEPVTAAVTNGWDCEALICESGRRLSAWATGVVETTRAATRYEVERDLMAGLSGRTEGSELLAVFRVRPDDLSRIPIDAGLLVTVFDRPSSHGNLGTSIRSCAAFGVGGVIVSGHGVDPYDPATISASRGALFAIPVVRVPSAADVFAWAERVRGVTGGCSVVGAETGADREIWSHDFRGPTILVAGSERPGLSRAYRERCDALVTIPMSGSVSSMNVSVATSIVLYEITRQRRAGGVITGRTADE
jgi:23S rRNA (uridine2479-2'-O)-methyltransferase